MVKLRSQRIYLDEDRTIEVISLPVLLNVSHKSIADSPTPMRHPDHEWSCMFQPALAVIEGVE